MKNKLFKIILIASASFLFLEFLLFFYERYNTHAFDSEYSIPCVKTVKHPIIYTYKKNCKKEFIFPYNSKTKYKINFETNSCFMRDSERYCKKLNKVNKNKIFFIGDSYTQNQYLHNKDNFPKIFEKQLEDDDINFDILNFGIPGYSLRQNMENLIKITKDLNIEGNKVVFQFLLNDLMDIQDNPPHKLKKYLKYSYTFRILNSVRRKILYPQNYNSLYQMLEADYNNPDKYQNLKKNFCKVNDYLVSKNAETILLFLPFMDTTTNWNEYKTENIEKKIIQTAKNCGWDNIIYMVPILKEKKFEDIVVALNINHHLNPTANKIISSSLFEHFRGKNLF